MVSRQWRGLIKPDKADDYIAYLRAEVFHGLSKLDGFKGASIYRRDVAKGVEFLVETKWESLDSVKAFSGPDVETAVVPAEARAMMVEFDPFAVHYELVD